MLETIVGSYKKPVDEDPAANAVVVVVDCDLYICLFWMAWKPTLLTLDLPPSTFPAVVSATNVEVDGVFTHPFSLSRCCFFLIDRSRLLVLQRTPLFAADVFPDVKVELFKPSRPVSLVLIVLTSF